jgi:hypothetical protein
VILRNKELDKSARKKDMANGTIFAKRWCFSQNVDLLNRDRDAEFSVRASFTRTACRSLSHTWPFPNNRIMRMKIRIDRTRACCVPVFYNLSQKVVSMPTKQ